MKKNVLSATTISIKRFNTIKEKKIVNRITFTSNTISFKSDTSTAIIWLYFSLKRTQLISELKEIFIIYWCYSYDVYLHQ